MQFSLGEANKTWQKYGLTEAPIIFNGHPTPFKAIIREGKLVNITGRSYYLLPNEEVLSIANQAAELAGLKPFTGGGTRNRKLIQEGNLFYNHDKTVMHAWYSSTNGTIDVEGEKLHVGCNVINSIDGSTAFGVSVFTFRHICRNGVIFGYRQISAVRHIHTQGLSKIVENLKNQMLVVMDEANAVIEKYRLLTQEMANEELIERLKKSRLPKKVLPDYLKPTEETEGYIPAVTQWQLYNDITAAIWHNASSDLRTKQFQFQTLHAIIKV